MSDATPPGPPGPPPDWRPPPPAPTAPPSAEPAAPPASGRGRQLLVVGLALVAALAVVAAAVIAPGVVDDLAGDGAAVAGDPGQTGAPEGGDPDPGVDPGLEDVLVVEGLSPEHRVGEDIDYEQVPPIGGPHDQVWLACGAYDEPVRDENAVHDLEHGTVWITYDPELGEDEVAALEAALPDNGILSPYRELPAAVVVTVWGAQLRLRGPDDPRLPLFIEEYGDGSTAPEPFASCEGGTDDPQGGPDGVPV